MLKLAEADDGTTGSTGGADDTKGAQGQGAGNTEDSSGTASSAETKGIWPEDWRQKFAGDDAKLVKRFERYQSPSDVAKALVAAQNKISEGSLRPALTKDATPEEIAQWRKDMGIPEAPDKYDLNLGNGLVIGDEDKPLIEEFLKAAHASNQTPEQVKSTLSAYYQLQDKLSEDRATSDEQAKIEGEEALRGEWGTDFKRNINMIHGFLDTVASPELKDAFLAGRLADGTPIGSSPEVLKMLTAIALQVSPIGTIVPPGQNQMKGLEDEIKSIESKMGTKEYIRDDKMQARYRELVEAREKMNMRKAG